MAMMTTITRVIMRLVLDLLFTISTPPLFTLAQLVLDSGESSDDYHQDNTHSIAVAVAVQLKGVVVDVIHNGHGGIVGAAGSQQLNQRKAMERIDGLL